MEVRAMNCTNCRRELTQGNDVVTLQSGVIGPRGFICLEEQKYFCDDECLEAYICDSETEKRPRRIP